MRLSPTLSKTRHCLGAMFAGFAMTVLLAPQSVASTENGDEMLRFFDPLPPEVIEKFSPAAAEILAAFPPTQSVAQTGTRPLPPPELLTPVITSAQLSGTPVIEFQVFDDFGFGVDGFVQGENVEFEFTVNKLMRGANGQNPFWLTYIRSADQGVERAQAGAYTEGTLEDLGDGNYRFTFDQPLEEISNVPFRPALTHRVGIEIRDAVVDGEEVDATNDVFDIQPSTGATSGIMTRKIVKQEACATCHGTEEFAFHGGPRKSVDYCVTCHQPFSRDVGTGNTMNFPVMIHKIHAGAQLNNLPFQFCGFGCENFGSPPDDFSEVHFPQDLRNCTNCHDPEDPETPQADWVANRPTGEVCASCHDNLTFDRFGLTNEKRNHPGLAQPNTTCSACHSENGLMVSALESHVIDEKVAAGKFQYNILEITNTAEGDSPIVTFSVTDPTNNDAPYDIANDPAFTGAGTRFVMDIAWPNSDFTNVANAAGTNVTGRATSVPVGVTLADSSTGLPQGVVDNGDGTYTVDTSMLPTPVVVPATNPPLGSGTIVLEGHLAADFNFDGAYDDEVPVTTVEQAFAITDNAVQPRRMVVDINKCQDCHGVNDGLALHGGNRVDNAIACSVCHNPNATDLFRRPADEDGVANGENLAAADDLEDRPIDLKYMVHAIHGAAARNERYIVYGFGGTAFDFSEVAYPRSPAECDACHVGDTYDLPLGDNVLATTVNAGATVTGAGFFGPTGFAPDDGSATDPTDDNNVSKTAAVCSSCHDSETARVHMTMRSDDPISFGSAFLDNPNPISDPDTQALIDMGPRENCTFCHAPDSFVPISEAHGLD